MSNTGRPSSIYKHNAGQYQTYYGVKQDHVIEATLVDSPFIAKTFEAVTYESETSLNGDYTELTFDRMIAYNDKQSTGLKNIAVSNPFGTNAASNLFILARRKDKYWRINELRDWSINNQAAIVDNEPNGFKIGLNKSKFTMDRMRDYYLNVRFYFKPTTNQKISTDLASVTHKPTEL